MNLRATVSVLHVNKILHSSDQ